MLRLSSPESGLRMDLSSIAHEPSSLQARSVTDGLRSLALMLGCPLGILEAPGLAVHSRRPNSATDNVIHTFSRGNVAVVSLPSTDALGFALGIQDAAELIEFARQDAKGGSVFDLRSARIVVDDEPPTMAVVDQHTLRTPKGAVASIVYNPKRVVMDALRESVSAREWEECGGNLVGAERVGALAGGMLVALATVEPADGRLARARVLVAPSFRGRGFGKVVLYEVARRTLGQGVLPYCRCAVDDVAARALARSIGFLDFARATSMRLVTAADNTGVLN